MEIEIIKDGVLQPMELFIGIFWLAFIAVIVTTAYVLGDLLLTAYPEVKRDFNKPAPLWSVFVLWALMHARRGK